MVTSDDCSREEKMFSSCLSTSFHVQQYGSIIYPFQVKIQTIPEQDGNKHEIYSSREENIYEVPWRDRPETRQEGYHRGDLSPSKTVRWAADKVSTLGLLEGLSMATGPI